MIFVKKSKFHDVGGPDTVVSPTVSRMEITFSLLAQTVIACLLVTVAVVCYVYGDEDSGGGDTEADREAGD